MQQELILEYGIGMSVYIMMVLSFLPLVILLGIFCFAIPGFKLHYGLVATVVGLFSLIPIVIIQHFVLKLPVFTDNTLVAALITVLVFNGLIEETVKMFSLLILPHKKLNFATFFSLCIIVGLSLGCFETVIYLFSGYHNIEVRSLTAVVMHSLCCGLSGIYVWTWRNPVEKANGTKSPYVQPFVWAIILHGAYNFFAGFSGGFYWFSIVAIVLTALECRIWYRKVLGLDEATGTTP